MNFDISSLMSEYERWEFAGYIAIGLVAIGALGESVAELTNWISSSLWVRRIAVFSALILIIGICFELLTQVESNNKNALIVSVLNKEAGDATKLAGPRNIRGRDIDHITEAIKSFRDTPYDLSIPPISDNRVVPELLEPGSFLVNQIISTLHDAGWKLHSIGGEIAKRQLPYTLATLLIDEIQLSNGQQTVLVPIILIGQITGVVGIKIIFDIKKNLPLRDPSFALAKALNDVDVWADVLEDPSEINIAADMINAEAIHVIVGTKP